MAEFKIEWNNLERVLNEFCDAFIDFARAYLFKNDSVATGDLYDSLDTEREVNIGEDYFSVKISLEDYWKYVDKGRGPGKFPPPEAITNWIEVKHIVPRADMNGRTPSVEQLSFLIGRKIAEEGTTPHPFFDQAREEALRIYDEKIDRAIIEDISEAVKKTVDEMLKDSLS